MMVMRLHLVGLLVLIVSALPAGGVEPMLLGEQGRVPVVVVASAGSDGSTLVFNMLRFILQGQFAGLHSGFEPELPFSEWDSWVSDFEVPVLVKAHNLPSEWMTATRRDGTVLVDVVFTVGRDPVEAVCSEVEVAEKMEEEVRRNEEVNMKLKERLELERVIEEVGGDRLVRVVDFEELLDRGKWGHIVKELEHRLGVTLSNHEMILRQLSLLKAPWAVNATGRYHPDTLLCAAKESRDKRSRLEQSCVENLRSNARQDVQVDQQPVGLGTEAQIVAARWQSENVNPALLDCMIESEATLQRFSPSKKNNPFGRQSGSHSQTEEPDEWKVSKLQADADLHAWYAASIEYFAQLNLGAASLGAPEAAVLPDWDIFSVLLATPNRNPDRYQQSMSILKSLGLHKNLHVPARRDSFEAREVCNRTREGTRNDASTPSNKSKIYILHALDYVEALKLGSVQEKEWVAIFEDDILLTVPAARARQVIADALAQLPASANALKLEWCWDSSTRVRFSTERPLIALSWSSYCSAATIYRKRDIGRIISVLYPVCAPVQPIDAQLSEAGSRTLLEVYQLRSPILVQDSRFRSAVDVYKALTLQHGLANGCLYREYDDFVEDQVEQRFTATWATPELLIMPPLHAGFIDGDADYWVQGHDGKMGVSIGLSLPSDVALLKFPMKPGSACVQEPGVQLCVFRFEASAGGKDEKKRTAKLRVVYIAPSSLAVE